MGAPCGMTTRRMSHTMRTEAGKPDIKSFHEKLDSAFHTADLNRDGVLDMPEFTLLVQQLGLDWLASEIQATFELLDPQKQGTIQAKEWHEAGLKFGHASSLIPAVSLGQLC